MAILNHLKISAFYDMFKAIDVAYSKEISQVTGLVQNQIFLKCVGDVWPCVIFSSSFEGAKVVVGLKSGILQKMDRANNMVSLRFCFKITEKGNPVTFFVNTKYMGHTPYGETPDVAMFNLRFTQRPPDDLIEIMGRILDANVNSVKRRDERVIISPETIRKLNLASKDGAVFIEGVPRNCILRDLAFPGARIIMMGVAKFLVGKKAALRVAFEDPRESFLIDGTLEKAEMVVGRKDLIVITMNFNENTVPMGYKLRMNDYISVIREVAKDAEEAGAPELAKAAAAPEGAKAPEAAEEAKEAPAPKAEAAKAETPAPKAGAAKAPEKTGGAGVAKVAEGAKGAE